MADDRGDRGEEEGRLLQEAVQAGVHRRDRGRRRGDLQAPPRKRRGRRRVAGASAPRGRLASTPPSTSARPTRARAMHGLSAFRAPAIDSRDGRRGSSRTQAARAAGVELRPLTTIEDADRILAVMIATWGEHQLLPREMIRALGDSGNTPWGAFDGDGDDRVRPGLVRRRSRRGAPRPFAHARDVARSPASRGGVCAQAGAARAVPASRGSGVVRWTFDPLLSRNAYFNLTKLGAIADRFLPNFYGEMTDTLNRGERSDRLMVRWDLEREPGGPSGAPGFEVLGRAGGDPEMPSPTDVRSPQGGSALDPDPARVSRPAGTGPGARAAMAGGDRVRVHRLLRTRVCSRPASPTTPRTS